MSEKQYITYLKTGSWLWGAEQYPSHFGQKQIAHALTEKEVRHFWEHSLIERFAEGVPEFLQKKAPKPKPVIEEVEEPEPKTIISSTARKLAEDKGIDVETIVGTGQAGRIKIEDVQALIAAKAIDE